MGEQGATDPGRSARGGDARAHPSAVPLTEIETTLRDGTPVLVRPIRPDDKGRLRDMFARLSEESRYRRFMGGMSELSDRQLRDLTDVDFVNHMAWIAFGPDEAGPALGAARCIRLEEEPDVAEVAVTVADDHHNRGLGTLLLAVLGATARAAGIRTFRAYVLEGNFPMRELLDNVGVKLHADSPGLLRMEVPVDLEDLPDSPAARALKALATEAISALPKLLAIPAEGTPASVPKDLSGEVPPALS